jgi:ATP/maltotriose-dependent transcriptional regulator MalT
VAELLPAVRDSAPAFVDRLIEEFEFETFWELGHADRHVPPGDARLDASLHSQAEMLSERELDVLRLIADGLSYPEIAARLTISVNTVRFHVKSLYGKLDVHRRLHAIERGRELRLLGS